LKAWLRCYQKEYDLFEWRNPIEKVEAPQRPKEKLDLVGLEDLRKLLDTCISGTFTGDRDEALIRSYVDTGARARELLGVNIGDVDFASRGMVVLGKGNKTRIVHFGRKTMRALRRYLRHRPSAKAGDPLWVIELGTRLTYSSVRDLVTDRSITAEIKRPKIHAFRRTFAITSLRRSMSLAALKKLMGHKDLNVTMRYLKLEDGDLGDAHDLASPADLL
jgi:site-specific recombinase XerD